MTENQTIKYLPTDINMLNMNNKKRLLIYFMALFSVMHIHAQTVQKEKDGVVFNVPSNVFNINKIKLKVWKDDIIQVMVSPKESFSERESLIITEKINDIPKCDVEETNKEIILHTQSITARIDKQNYNISFSKSDGTVLLSENEKNRIEKEAAVQERIKSLKLKFGDYYTNLILTHSYEVGMTKYMIEESLGKPDKVNRTVNQFGNSEQWIYENQDLYLYFDGDKLTSYQEHK